VGGGGLPKKNWRRSAGRRLPTPRNSKLGREVAVDLKPDADFNQNWRCPCHDGSILRLALPRTATLRTADIAKEMRYKRPPLLAQQLRQLGDVCGDVLGFPSTGKPVCDHVARTTAATRAAKLSGHDVSIVKSIIARCGRKRSRL